MFVIVCCKTFSAKVFAREHAEPIDRAYTEFILFKPEYELIRYEEDGDEEEEEHACAPKEEVEHAETKDPLDDEEDDEEDAFDVRLAEEDEEAEMVLLEAVKTLALLSAADVMPVSFFLSACFLVSIARALRINPIERGKKLVREQN